MTHNLKESFTEITSAWHSFIESSNYLLHPLEDDAHYDEVAAFLDKLLEQRREHAHPDTLDSLIDYATTLINDYDTTQVQLPEADAKDVLAFLMAERGLKQVDLAHLIPQSVLSQLLSGKRKFSANHARVLGEYFGVSAAVFL